MGVLCAIILFYKIINSFGYISGAVGYSVNVIIKFLSPFIYGFFIAYFLHPAMHFFETKVFLKIKGLANRLSLRRMLSVITTYILLIGTVVWLIAYLVPEVAMSIDNLVQTLPQNFKYLEQTFFVSGRTSTLDEILASFNEAFSTSYTSKELFDMVLEPVFAAISSLPTVIGALFKGTINIAGVLLNFILGAVIGFYFLCDKEKIGAAIHKFLLVVFKRITVDRIIFVAKTSNLQFEKFFIGKVIDSTIIGGFFLSVCLFIRAPYAILLSLIIGVTNMIPYFGPFIGAVPVVFIVLLISPKLALWLTIAIIVLQQFDGIFLGPKIIGDSTGLKPIAVIFAILVGGKLFGPLGMFFGVPVFAVLKNMFTSIIDRRYDRRYYIAPETEPEVVTRE